MTGSRLLMLSKNSDVSLAGVAGMTKLEVSLSSFCLSGSSVRVSVEVVEKLSGRSAAGEKMIRSWGFERGAVPIALSIRTIRMFRCDCFGADANGSPY